MSATTPESVEPGGSYEIDASFTTTPARCVIEKDDIINECHRCLLYLEQDFRFLERRITCELKEMKELRETYTDWEARVANFTFSRRGCVTPAPRLKDGGHSVNTAMIILSLLVAAPDQRRSSQRGGC